MQSRAAIRIEWRVQRTPDERVAKVVTRRYRPRIDDSVNPKIVDELSKRFKDFCRASTENGLSLQEFNSFGATRRTLRQFIKACYDLNALVLDTLIPNPDEV